MDKKISVYYTKGVKRTLLIKIGAVVCGGILIVGALIYFWYTNKKLAAANAQLVKDLKVANDSFAQIEKDKNNLLAALEAAAAKNQSFANELDNVTETMYTLQRLTSTDKELLSKYSKVYFLNENYKPTELSLIDTKYLYNKSSALVIHDRVLMFLQKMLRDAEQAGVNLQIVSSYRSFGTQAALKSSYKVKYGTGANAFSADQGYSEHQLGTTLDFTTAKIGTTFSGFEKTAEYKWLTENAYKYGFILSYPPNNSYYIYEPWHWRFVGLDLALYLHNENKNFYDLDQRIINGYLVNFFNGTTTGFTYP